MASSRAFFASLLALLLAQAASFAAEPFVTLDPPSKPAGYLAYLLINEAPFPGERGYVSISGSQSSMLAILWVLHGRIECIPQGYSQKEVAGLVSSNLLDIIAGTGAKRQCEGFYKDMDGSYAVERRVGERIAYLQKIANKGERPGNFAALLNHAKYLARIYFDEGMPGVDRYAGIKYVNRIAVTGGAFSWMTDKECFHPGGNFVKIPDSLDGSLSGNRFFTLRKEKK